MKEYFFQKTGVAVTELVVTGGSALLPGLLDFLKDNLKLEIMLGDPFYNLQKPSDFDTEENWVLFANVTGLALRSITKENKQNINLKTKDEKTRTFIKRWWI